MNYETKIRNVTLCFLIDEDNNKILLGRKKYGEAKDKVNGFGGKVEESDTTITDALIREFYEETSAKVIDPELRSIINFHNIDTSTNTNELWRAYVYIATKWDGEPKESNEMTVEWIDKNQVPFDQMWENDRLWFNIIMSGKQTEIDLIEEDKKLTEFSVKFVETLNQS